MRFECCVETHPGPTEAATPQILPYGTEIYFPPSSPPQRSEGPPSGERKTVLCSLAGAPPYTHFWHHSLPTPIPSTNTALRTANTAPSTMRFWEAASRWRSQEERIPTVGLSGETAEVRGSKSRNGVGGVATLSTAGRLGSRSLTSVRLARIELRCLEKVEEDAAGKPGPRLRVLLTASYREEDKAEGKG